MNIVLRGAYYLVASPEKWDNLKQEEIRANVHLAPSAGELAVAVAVHPFAKATAAGLVTYAGLWLAAPTLASQNEPENGIPECNLSGFSYRWPIAVMVVAGTYAGANMVYDLAQMLSRGRSGYDNV